MTPLLDRVQGELRRRASPPAALGFLRDDELRALRTALNEPLDVAAVGRLEHRARTRQRIGLPPFFEHTAEPGTRVHRHHPTEFPCVKNHGGDWCQCVDQALDSGRKISTVRGLLYQANLFHFRRHPAEKPVPEWRPRRLATLLPFKRKPATEALVPDDPFRLNPVKDPSVLDPVLLQRPAVETLEQLADRLHVPLYPQPPEGSYRR